MDVQVPFTADDVARTRFAVSPMWEVVTSFRLLTRPSVPAPYDRWAARVRPLVRSAGLDRGRLADLVPPDGFLADLLTPLPATAFPTLAEELAAVRATDPAHLVEDVDALVADGRVPAARLAPLREADPAATLAQVADEAARYWEIALAPWWSRIRTVLEADVFQRARSVAGLGAAQVLNELHESVSWDEGTLNLVRRSCKVTRQGAGAGLVLVPSVFLRDRVLTRTTPPDPPQLAYPALGAGTVWEPRPAGRLDALAAVLGRSRALLLAELDSPASTTQLAQRAGLTAAGVSQHLTAMRDAGLVSAHRAGRSVLYARTVTADALVGPRA